MQPVYKPPFTKFVKKQHAPVQLAIADAVDEILEDPMIGEKKVGDLKGVSVFKFSLANVEYLIAYRPPSEVEKLDEERISSCCMSISTRLARMKISIST